MIAHEKILLEAGQEDMLIQIELLVPLIARRFTFASTAAYKFQVQVRPGSRYAGWKTVFTWIRSAADPCSKTWEPEYHEGFQYPSTVRVLAMNLEPSETRPVEVFAYCTAEGSEETPEEAKRRML